jgi:DNA-binding CsgD family transcriptional regulator/tetratricopeptide (TPR) repeat protein
VGLLERDHELAVIGAVLASAAGGNGGGVAVTGDAGTGKSVLLEAACAGASGVRVLRGSCDPLRTPRPLGPFRDLARSAGLQMLDGDIPLATVCEQVYDALRETPTALLVEDLHWVDEASVDVLRFLARRLDAMPLAVLVSYRDTEVGPRHPARSFIEDVARLDMLRALVLRPLSLDAVRTLLGERGPDPERVLHLTGGNPFFVTEIAKEPDRPLPTSVRDAVLARTSGVAPEDLEVLQLAAAAPGRLDHRVLPALGVDLPTLRRLDATGLLARHPGGLEFQHELSRRAIESTIPPGGEPHLHARLLAALERLDPMEPAVLSHHAVAALDAAKATRYAEAAAADAIRAGSHSEAVAFFETALAHLDGATMADRAGLLLRLAFEQYMTSHLADAIDTVRATFPIWQDIGDDAGLAAAYETCSVLEYYNGCRAAALAHAEQAATVAERSGADLAYGAARATRGFLAYLGNDLALAASCAEQASDVAGRHGQDALRLRGGVVRSLATLAAGDGEVRRTLMDQIEVARSRGWDELASTGYSQLASLDVEFRRFRAAQHTLEESLPFTVARDIPICHHWQTGVRSRLHFALGRWNAALEDSGSVLEHDGMPIARLWPHIVAGLVALRRGAPFDAEQLDRAWDIATLVDEPLRRLPVLSALAEVAWMTGTPDSRVCDDALHTLQRSVGVPGTQWAAGELAVWLHRLDLLSELPDAVAEPFRAARAGRFDDAASWWAKAGEPFAEAMVLGDSPDPGLRARGVELLDRLGAIATADRRRAELRRDGVVQVPQRPRISTRANPGGLTNRQLDVARLVARGFTNAEIASRLFISPKTADHHVSAVLTKLGLPSRRAVMVQADELGLA